MAIEPAAATAHCIYCDKDLPLSDFSDEHIWPDGLGGDALDDFWRTRVCRRCNNSSGVYVDGAFLKSWVGQAERASGTDDYLSPSAPERSTSPFAFLGSTSEGTAPGEVADLWVGTCGAEIVHLRAADEESLFASYAGGDPRRSSKRRTAGRAYLAIRSPEPFWQKVALSSFKHQFERVSKFLVTKLDSGVSTDLPTLDPDDPQHRSDLPVVRSLLEAPTRGHLIQVDPIVGGRLQAKLGLALGYKLFGEKFGTTPYSKVLRSAFREGDPEKLRQSKVIGSGILTSSLAGTETLLRWPGGWLLWLRRQNGKVILIVVSPSARSFSVMITDDAALAQSLDRSFDEGKAWVVVPVIDQAVGPIWFPDYAAHMLREIENRDLADLEARRTDRSLLPGCGF